MIYLSKLVLNPASRQVQAELRDPYQMHRTLAKAFGADGDFERARCLFRIDELRSSGALYLLVQSLAPPNWERLTASARYLQDAPQVTTFEPRLAEGQRLAFRLHANPTVKRERKRYLISGEGGQLDWLRRKGEQHGFALLSARVSDAQTFCSQTAAGQRAQLVGVRFDGLLCVTDAQALVGAVAHGIGSGKGFGFGLLSLARR